MRDLVITDMVILDRWCDFGVHKGSGTTKLFNHYLTEHPMSQFAFELGVKEAQDRKLTASPNAQFPIKARTLK